MQHERLHFGAVPEAMTNDNVNSSEMNMYQFQQYFWRCALVVFLALSLSAWGVDSAIALLRQHHDFPGVLRYHSQVSIKDTKGYTWQVLLFKQNYQSVTPDLRLRLVGFCDLNHNLTKRSRNTSKAVRTKYASQLEQRVLA